MGTKLGFGPYADWDYEEVLTRNPSCSKFPIEEGSMGNLEGRFTYWVMASMADALPGVTEGEVIAGDPTAPEQSKEELEKHADKRRRTKVRHYVSPSLRNLLEGGGSAQIKTCEIRNLKVRRPFLPPGKHLDS